jgi:predicted outer membrane repeat protein
MKLAIFSLVMGAALLALAGCNNFFHELVPPDGNYITEFTVEGQRGEALMSDDTVTVYVNEGQKRTSLVPHVAVSEKAALITLTLDYVQAAFPSIEVARTVAGIESADPVADFAVDLIRNNHDFSVIPITTERPIDFTGPVRFLVVGGQGSMRQYTVNIYEWSDKAKLLGFGFSKYENPALVRDGIVTGIDETNKKVNVYVTYPLDFFKAGEELLLAPDFEILGERVTIAQREDDEELDLPAGHATSFDPWPSDLMSVALPPAMLGVPAELQPLLDGLNIFVRMSPLPTPYTQTRYLTVHREGTDSAQYELVLYFLEDTRTLRSITDFRFTKEANSGIVATSVGSIIDSEATGSISLQVLYQGTRPQNLLPAIISPGNVTVSLDGGISWVSPAAQSIDYYGRQIKYKVISKNGLYIRIYTVTVDYYDMTNADPLMYTFSFPIELNSCLVATAIGEISGTRILIKALYAGEKPAILTPVFSSNGLVRVAGLVQTSGASYQNFSWQLKYTVHSLIPGISTSKDYWVEVMFERDDSSAAIINVFGFESGAANPTLTETRTGNIDQPLDGGTGTIYVYVPVGTGTASVALKPFIEAKGTVTVWDAATNQYEPADSVRRFDAPLSYLVVSQNGLYRRMYTVRVIEISSTVYVNLNATGLNSGTSWEDAFISLQAACVAVGQFSAAIPKYIWIAKGNYAAPAGAAFPVVANTSYIGGFAGYEALKSGRLDIAGNAVTISGGGLMSLFKNDALTGSAAAFEDLCLETVGSGDAALSVKYSGAGGSVKISGMQFSSPGRAALAVDSGSVVIEESSFENALGGAVRVTDSNSFSAPLSVKRSRFANLNTSGTAPNGGAIYFSGYNQSVLTIEECAFENISGANGGAIYADNCTPELKNLHFLTSATEYLSATGAGGAIYIYRSSNVNISGIDSGADTPLQYVKSARDGGAIYIYSSNGIVIADLKVKHTQAGYSGGAVFIGGNSSGITISGMEAEDTRAVYSGGAVSITESIGYTAISNMIAVNTQAGDAGGALYYTSVSTNPGAIAISNASFTNNSATLYGGGAILSVYGTPMLNNIRINIDANGNPIANAYTSAGGYGGAINLDECAGMTLNNIVTYNTEAKAGGGGSIYLHNRSGNASITKVKITKAKASGYSSGFGGAIYMTNSSGGMVKLGADAATQTNPDIIIDDTEAECMAGAISVYNEGSPTSSVILNGISTNNTRGLQGLGSMTVAMVNGGYTTIKESTITNASAPQVNDEFHWGSALHISDFSLNQVYSIIKNVTISGSITNGMLNAGIAFDQNRAPLPPAELHYVDIDGLRVENVASIVAPAVFVSPSPLASITMRNSQFNNCIATGGGKIFLMPSPVAFGTMDISNCTVNGDVGAFNSNWY